MWLQIALLNWRLKSSTSRFNLRVAVEGRQVKWGHSPQEEGEGLRGDE